MKISDDDNLIRFLKENEPFAQPVQIDHEARLMALLDTQPKSSRSRRSRVIWLLILPTAIAAGVTMILSQSRSPTFAPEIAENPTTTLAETGKVGDEDLNTFLEDSWSNSLGKNLDNETETVGYTSFVTNPEQ